MKVINRIGVLDVPNQAQSPHLVVLHDTVSPTRTSAEHGLESRGLGYHFIIERDGSVAQYAPLDRVMYHARGYNSNSLGISYVGGGKYGPVNEVQIQASIDLINDLKQQSHLDSVTGHKHASSSGKIDPRFPGEPENGIDEEIDFEYMNRIANETGLKFFRGRK